MDTEVNVHTLLLIAYNIQLITGVMAVLSRSVLNQTSVRSQCSTTADTTLNGRSQMTSNHVATDAWLRSVFAFGFTTDTKKEEENDN